jgi:hypothetical protein
MAQYSGTAGSVVYMTGGTTAIGEIMEWSFDPDMSEVEVTAFGDRYGEFIPGINRATGSFSGNFDAADTSQLALVNSYLGGSAVALRLQQGAKYWNIGTSYITGFSNSISYDGKGEISYDFRVSGAFTLV